MQNRRSITCARAGWWVARARTGKRRRRAGVRSLPLMLRTRPGGGYEKPSWQLVPAQGWIPLQVTPRPLSSEPNNTTTSTNPPSLIKLPIKVMVRPACTTFATSAVGTANANATTAG